MKHLFLSLVIISGNIIFAQDNFNYIQINLYREGGPVHAGLIVEDELGRKTGRAPLSKTTFREIPNSQYGDEGGLKNLTNIFSVEEALEGIYSIKVIGWKIDSYKIFIRAVRGTNRANRNGKSYCFKGISSYGIESNYQLNYHTDPDSEIVAEKVVNSCSDIRQDLDLCYKIGWITNKGIYNSLSKKIDNAEKQADKGKSKTAINNLNAFINEVEAQRDKHITEDAAVILVEDAEALIRNW